MSEYKDVITALSTKLKKDRENVEWEDGIENLNYIMDVRLEQEVADAIVDAGMAKFPEALDLASVIATRYLDWLIELGV